MKRQGLQEMVKSIFSDESTCSKFASDPQSVISAYELTATEKKAVLSPRLRAALVSGDSTLVQSEMGVLISWF